MPVKQISKDTILCVSIAQHPSNFGTILFNAAFAHKDIDAIYKALQVRPESIREAIAGLRALGIRGCGVSMPFKTTALRYVDSVDPSARKIGAINTIVNTRGRLKGYNTDYVGARQALRSLGSLRKKTVILLGSGGVAQAIAAALQSGGATDVLVVSRNTSQGARLARKWRFSTRPWQERSKVGGDLLINATPLGMAGVSNSMPVTSRILSRFDAVMDVVINPLETRLQREAKKQGKRVIPGYIMSLHQAARQFELYTGKQAPLTLMQSTIKKVYNP